MASKIDAKKVAEMRSNQIGWQKIADELGDGSTAFGIRCREAWYRLEVAEKRIPALKATPVAVRTEREKGAGWSLIAIRAGISVGEAKKLAKKADDSKVAKNELTGRNYVRNHSPGAAIVHKERMEGVEVAPEPTPAPKPRRVRRSAKKAA